ncbi:hypothetical protein L9F63_000527 [Diploptera punctata]|uniref:Ubiquitin-like domain-containing protein n=1 Tax=Diploptera punctata TaxID=6984 RepID=A0AAD8AM89_DIPPU|nr:hypothetical protein L9F63_000527 [Diploptera punctata]
MPSLLEAIDKKYGKEENENCGLELPIAIYVPKKSPRNSIPSLLVLNDCDIETAGDDQELEKICQGVEELDLAQNKLARWTEVFDILKHMPRVKFVNLSFNILTEEICNVDNRNPFPYLKNLVLNGTHINWKSVQELLKLLPSLEELHLSLNNYSHIDLGDDSNYDNVKKVHFTGNPVTTWREICKLGLAFPTLESLVLAECPLESLDPNNRSARELRNGRTESESESNSCPSINSPHSCFRMLKFLNLNNTLLSTWDEVDRVSRFPALLSLRLQGCPLFEYPQGYTEHERRQYLIARLPNIQTLNGGGMIGDEEREDAERAFIRFYMDKAEADRPDRYTDLVAVHGKLDPLVSIDLSPEKRVKVRFTYGEINEVKSIIVYQSVQELKQKLESFAGIPASRMKLFYLDQDMKDMGPEEMKFPNKQLYSYNISTGDEIIVDSKH